MTLACKAEVQCTGSVDPLWVGSCFGRPGEQNVLPGFCYAKGLARTVCKREEAVY